MGYRVDWQEFKAAALLIAQEGELLILPPSVANTIDILIGVGARPKFLSLMRTFKIRRWAGPSISEWNDALPVWVRIPAEKFDNWGEDNADKTR